MKGLIDTDVVYKTAIYGLLQSFCNNPPSGIKRVAILTATRFVVIKKICKKQPPNKTETILKTLKQQLLKIEMMEPTEEETKMAETLEYNAAMANLNLDFGESQLCALLISRSFEAIFTGDKRAIKAMEGINKSEEFSGALNEKITCFEQIIIGILEQVSVESVRESICENKGTDRAVETCFSCTSKNISIDSVTEGLVSYIKHIIKEAPTVMNSMQTCTPCI